MDLEYFHSTVDMFAMSGHTLNLEKFSLLHASLTLLQNDNHFKKVYFWGKVLGLDCDYYIAFGYTKDILKGIVFYYSKNAIDWVLLPKTRDMENYLSLIITSRFQGDQSLQVDVMDDKPIPGDEYEAGSDTVASKKLKRWFKIPVYVLKEEDRLASVVASATAEGAVVPRGALYKHPNGDVVPNETFCGLKMDEALVLNNYCHFRRPLGKWDANLLKRADYNYSIDFLDTIDSDIPINCSWSMQLINYNRTVMVRSLYWPGMTSFHNLESRIYGFVFFGLGKRNLDIPFMVG
ncbi:radial spoke head protein 9 homolog [Cimex lectularius]|uniref:Radial spoke head protein 9 homolog n=1 Tax=Cimex lectularius TaxID=79782 RepID=A0A8I6TDN6_CIMLE|nr:radial spoke head protein 9 homolog [Cimex lectularius]